MDIFLSLTGDESFQVNVYLMEGRLFVAVLFQLRFYKIAFKDVVLMMVYTPPILEIISCASKLEFQSF